MHTKYIFAKVYLHLYVKYTLTSSWPWPFSRSCTARYQPCGNRLHSQEKRKPRRLQIDSDLRLVPLLWQMAWDLSRPPTFALPPSPLPRLGTTLAGQHITLRGFNQLRVGAPVGEGLLGVRRDVRATLYQCPISDLMRIFHCPKHAKRHRLAI